MNKPSKDFSKKPHSEFSAWDDAKFAIGGLLALLFPFILLGLIVAILFF
jgi:hypothetical protein